MLYAKEWKQKNCLKQQESNSQGTWNRYESLLKKKLLYIYFLNLEPAGFFLSK